MSLARVLVGAQASLQHPAGAAPLQQRLREPGARAGRGAGVFTERRRGGKIGGELDAGISCVARAERAATARRGAQVSRLCVSVDTDSCQAEFRTRVRNGRSAKGGNGVPKGGLNPSGSVFAWLRCVVVFLAACAPPVAGGARRNGVDIGTQPLGCRFEGRCVTSSSGRRLFAPLRPRGPRRSMVARLRWARRGSCGTTELRK